MAAMQKMMAGMGGEGATKKDREIEDALKDFNQLTEKAGEEIVL